MIKDYISAFSVLGLDNLVELRDEINKLIDQKIELSKTQQKKKTKYLPGVSWSDRYHCFRARIYHNNKRIEIGRYKTEEQAHAAYLRAKHKYNK